MNSFSLASASVQFSLMLFSLQIFTFFLPLVSLYWPVGAWSGESFLFSSQGSSGEKKTMKPKSYFTAISHLPFNSWFCAFCDWLPCVAPGGLGESNFHPFLAYGLLLASSPGNHTGLTDNSTGAGDGELSYSIPHDTSKNSFLER